jgi:hypothetical protein
VGAADVLDIPDLPQLAFLPPRLFHRR